jgi:hypothetical protein
MHYFRSFNVHLVIYNYSSLLNPFGMFIEHTKTYIIKLYSICSRSRLVPRFRIFKSNMTKLGIEPLIFGLLGQCSTIELFVILQIYGAKRLESHTSFYKWEGYMKIRPTLKIEA